MNNIIIPVDFSDTAKNALLYAAEIAKRASGKLIILHIPKSGDDEQNILTALNNLASELKSTMQEEIHCQVRIGQNDLVEELKKIIEEENIDLIVMGTNGASGLKKMFIGSNTVKVIEKIKMPLLVLPGSAKYADYVNTGKNRIVLATDLHEMGTECTLDVLKEIGMLFNAPQLVVLNVRPDKTKLPIYKRIERNFVQSLFRPEIETTRATVFSSNVINGIRLYLDKKTDTGLVAMVARKSSSILEKHYTREMASYADLPLLILHDKTS
jgi:nucleotide-binding universal stress UspA family protein